MDCSRGLKAKVAGLTKGEPCGLQRPWSACAPAEQESRKAAEQDMARVSSEAESVLGRTWCSWKQVIGTQHLREDTSLGRTHRR